MPENFPLDIGSQMWAADYVNGRVIFDIGGNKYRVLARIDYTEQAVRIVNALTHEQ
jgi:mRNA-degrading endonuclease HigB of HigAB toxin-antitoxin module